MRAAFGVEIEGEIICKDGRRIRVTDKAIPNNLRLLIELLISEKFEDIFKLAYAYENLILTYYKIFNLQ